MQAFLLRIFSWLGQKAIAAALIVLIALAGYALWLFVQEEGILESTRVQRLQEAIANRERLIAAKAAVEQRLVALAADVEKQKQNVKQAEKIMAALRELQSWWDRWFGNRPQQSANAEQLKKMEELKQSAVGKWSQLQNTITETAWQKDGIEGALRRVEGEIGHLEASRSRVRHFVVLAWDKTKWLILLALAGYFFGPTVWAFAMYYGVAAVMSRGRPILLGPEPSALPQVSESHVSVEAVLRPGEILRIKEKFLQTSDEGVEKRTRFVLDWRVPLTSIACGLIELVELRNGRGAGEYRITLSNGDDPHIELAQVEVPAGSSLVLRPSFLAGVIQRGDDRLEIRRHWRIFNWQSWISGQFRFFEFMGPCRLVVSGSRGVRAERLTDREGQPAPARRTNQDATIAFTPNLAYRPVRAETFWSYYRGMNPLFDDLFSGRGLFVLQETARDGAAAKAGRFWSGIWNAVLKVFGL
jgi:hypothetical protein